MTLLTTGRVIDRKRLESQGWVCVDVTVKSAKGPAKDLAPTWDMVMGYKKGRMSKEEYTKKYEEILARAQRKRPDRWSNTLKRHEKLAFLCYCPPKQFCHRHLLVKAFVSFAKENGIAVKHIPERTTL